MPGRKPKTEPPVLAVASPRLSDRFDELNLGRLGLISVQERIPSDFTSWEIEFEVDGQPAKLSCVSPPEVGGVPHGLDGDIMNAILALYVEQGAPENGAITVTAHAILKRAGLQTSGRYYQILHESLDRLSSAAYTAKEAWRDHGRRKWTTQKFIQIQDLRYTGGEQHVANGTIISFRIAEQIAASVRAKFLKPLDAELLTQLQRPLSRALYRLLDAKRYDPSDPKVIVMDLPIELVTWARECKINDIVPAKIRRTLAPAHDELLTHGYLENVEYEGRGSKQIIKYRFGDGPSLGIDLLEKLIRHGVGRHVAQTLVRDTPRETLELRLAKAEFLLARDRERIQNKAGFVVSVLKDDGEKYPDPEGWKPPTYTTSTTPATTAPVLTVTPEDAEEHLRRYDQELRSKPLGEQAAEAMRRISMIAAPHLHKLGTARASTIQSAMEDGTIDPVAVIHEITRAVFDRRADEFLKTLLKEAASPARRHQSTLLSSVTDDHGDQQPSATPKAT